MSDEPAVAVFFDALDTLFRLTPPHVIVSHVMSRLGHELDEAATMKVIERANRWWMDPTRQLGRTVSEDLAERRHYVRMVLEDFGRPDDTRLAAQLLEDGYWAHWVRPYIDARPVLVVLSRNVRLALLSNGGPSIFDAVRHTGLADFFEQMSAGLEVGVQKPEPEAYLSAMERLHVTPELSWLVDDTPENVEGAEACGMRGVLLDRKDEWHDWPGTRIGSLDKLVDLLPAHGVRLHP